MIYIAIIITVIIVIAFIFKKDKINKVKGGYNNNDKPTNQHGESVLDKLEDKN